MTNSLGRGAGCQLMVVPLSLEKGSLEVGEAPQLLQRPPAPSGAINKMRCDGAGSASSGKAANGIQLLL